MISLIPSFQTYHWGKTGEESYVGRIVKSWSPDSFKQEEHYAEVWLGTHSSGPSKLHILKSNSSSLSPEFFNSHKNQDVLLSEVLKD